MFTMYYSQLIYMVTGWVDQSEMLMIPDCVGIKLSIAVGLVLSTDQEWDDYRNMLLRCVRHLAVNDAVKGHRGRLCAHRPTTKYVSNICEYWIKVI